MAKSPSEYIRELGLDVRAMAERESALRDHVNDLKTRDLKRQEELLAVRLELANLKEELAASKQQLQDHIAQYQEWDR